VVEHSIKAGNNSNSIPAEHMSKEKFCGQIRRFDLSLRQLASRAHPCVFDGSDFELPCRLRGLAVNSVSRLHRKDAKHRRLDR
jgi:hypothetical protein